MGPQGHTSVSGLGAGTMGSPGGGHRTDQPCPSPHRERRGATCSAGPADRIQFPLLAEEWEMRGWDNLLHAGQTVER